MPIKYDYLINKTNEQKLPNARLRNEFIRAANQDPGAFYSKYGYPTPTPPSMEAPGAATVAPSPIPVSQEQGLGQMFNPSPYMTGDTIGMEQDARGIGRGLTDGRGILGDDPALGGILGGALGLSGLKNAGLAGQVLSGTPRSMMNAGIGTVAGKVLGPYAGPVMMAAQSMMSGKAPSAANIAKMALGFTPLAPLVGAYNLGQGVVGYLSEREKDKLNEEYSVNNIMGPVNNTLGIAPSASSKPSGFLGGLRDLFSVENPDYYQDNGQLAFDTVGNSYGLGGGGYTSDLGLSDLANEGLISDASRDISIDSSSPYSLGVDPFNPDPYGLMGQFGQSGGGDQGGGYGGYGGDTGGSDSMGFGGEY